ncbi:MAG: hypothetical protein ACP5N7_05305 [Candidatus Pacearchaeota archaeon]
MSCQFHPSENVQCGCYALCVQCRRRLGRYCDCHLRKIKEEAKKVNIEVIDLKATEENHILNVEEVIPPLIQIKRTPVIVEDVEKKTLEQIEIENMISELQKKRDEEEAAKTFELELMKQELKQKNDLINKLSSQFGNIHDETERAYLKGKLEENQKLLKILEEDKKISQRVKTQYIEESKDNLKVEDNDINKIMDQLEDLPKCLTDHENIKRESVDSLETIEEEPKKKKEGTIKKKKKIKKFNTMDRLEKMYLEGLKKQRDKNQK